MGAVGNGEVAVADLDMKPWEHEWSEAFWANLNKQKPVECSQSDVDDWPVWIVPLVEQFGPQAVWDASLEVHGCPPTWCRGAGEARAIEVFLQGLAKSLVPTIS